MQCAVRANTSSLHSVSHHSLSHNHVDYGHTTVSPFLDNLHWPCALSAQWHIQDDPVRLL